MKLPHLSLILFVPVGLVAGYLGAGLFLREGNASVPPKGGTSMAPGISALDSTRNGLPAELQAKIDAIRGGRTASERMALTTLLADVRDPGEIRELLRHVHQLSGDMSVETAQAVLLNTWLALEPDVALQWCRDNAPKFAGALMASWAERDATAARAYVLKLGHWDQVSGAAGGVLEALARQNPEEAFAFLGELARRGSDSLYEIQSALESLAGRDPDALLARAEGFPSNLRTACRTAVAKALAEDDPAAALAWWGTQPDRATLSNSLFRDLPPDAWETGVEAAAKFGAKGLQEIASALAYDWGREDPARVVALLSDINMPELSPPESMFNSGFSYLFDQWSRTDAPAAAAAYLTLENPPNNSAQNIARALAKKDPAAARVWAESIADEGLRSAALAALERPDLDRSNSPRTAHEFIERAATSDDYIGNYAWRRLPPEEQARLIPLLAEREPEEAATAVSRMLQNSEALPFATTGAMLAALQPTGSEAGEQLVQSASNFAHTWAHQVPEEAARWAETLAPGPMRDGSVGTVAASWHDYDPEAARTWAESLPDEAARAVALKALGNP